MVSEFDLIRRHFTRPTQHTDLGVGDDGALFRPRPGMQLVVSTDMLVEGTHFLPDTPAEELGWKTLAVNLSDLAAMGAEPRWAVLAVALPDADATWLRAFAEGFFACARTHDVDVIGGDTTRGPRNLCPTVFGEVPTGMAITRGGARAGDDLWITGQPGRAALGLAALQGRGKLAAEHRDACVDALQRPVPRVAAGLGLRGIARAMLDVSDGLLGDLGHLLRASRTGAALDATALPDGELVAACGSPETARQALLTGGDDYELLFAAPIEARKSIASLGTRLELPMHRIGTLTPTTSVVELVLSDGSRSPLSLRGFDHFA
ncbi:MAG: thiamine-phosphate kinase [Zoogloeaceae bacterium]|nr:thiamine-phosphate kinase [Zoogloeaceae bacterium]